MDRNEIRARCIEVAQAIAAQPRDTQTYWVRQVLEALEAQAGDGYTATLVEIRSEIDARLIMGEW